jgi:hypothetical protein
MAEKQSKLESCPASYFVSPNCTSFNARCTLHPIYDTRTHHYQKPQKHPKNRCTDGSNM